MKINPGDSIFPEEARETIKKRWAEQGIWNSKWNQFANGQWKQEELLDPDSEPETNSEAGSPPPPFSLSPKLR
jgi:hypothetical protein